MTDHQVREATLCVVYAMLGMWLFVFMVTGDAIPALLVLAAGAAIFFMNHLADKES